MHPDVEGVDFRLGFRWLVATLVTVMVVVVIVFVMVVVRVVVGRFFIGLLRVLVSGILIMVMMMAMMVLVQMLFFVMLVGLFRVLKTGTLIVMVVTMVVVMLVEVAPGKCRQGHPQHHQEQSEGDVNSDIFRARFLLLDGDGASPPHLGVIHPREFPKK